MSETLKKVENIIERTNNMDVEKLSKDKNALSEDSPLMKLLMESVKLLMEVVKLGWKMIYTLPDLDENEMNKVVKEMLDDDKVKTLK